MGRIVVLWKVTNVKLTTNWFLVELTLYLELGNKVFAELQMKKMQTSVPCQVKLLLLQSLIISLLEYFNSVNYDSVAVRKTSTITKLLR